MKKQTFLVDMWPVSRPKPYPANAKKLTSSDIAAVARSISEFGWQQPIVVDKADVIIAGHARHEAAKLLGHKQVPVHVATDLTDAQIRAYRLADNRLSENRAWDMKILGLEMSQLALMGCDLASTAFAGVEIDKLLGAQTGDPNEDQPVKPSTIATSLAGDVWLCGPHRVVCGDSTLPEAVAAALGSAKPLLMVTDPPYGVDYDPAWRDTAPGVHAATAPNQQTGLVKNDGRADWTPAFAHFPGNIAYVWHSGLMAAGVAINLAAAGLEIRCQIIWNKQQHALSRGDYHWKHEPCWYAVRKGQKGRWRGDRKQSTVWDIKNLSPFGGGSEAKTGHATQKPVECMRRPLLNHLDRGEAVYDPFLGSGSTLMAAESIERVCYGIEIDPLYVDVIVKRWQDQVGQVATLQATGAAFGDVAKKRVKSSAKGA